MAIPRMRLMPANEHQRPEQVKLLLHRDAPEYDGRIDADVFRECDHPVMGKGRAPLLRNRTNVGCSRGRPEEETRYPDKDEIERPDTQYSTNIESAHVDPSGVSVFPQQQGRNQETDRRKRDRLQIRSLSPSYRSSSPRPRYAGAHVVSGGVRERWRMKTAKRRRIARCPTPADRRTRPRGRPWRVSR
jgi:hypothetical protein